MLSYRIRRWHKPCSRYATDNSRCEADRVMAPGLFRRQVMKLWYPMYAIMLVCMGLCCACGEETANEQLIGGECASVADCDDQNDDTPTLECLQGFKGGYCGRAGCSTDADCPEGSLCADLDGTTYCFLVCTDKIQCNENRTVDNESNCSSSVDPVAGGEEKLCIPPSA